MLNSMTNVLIRDTQGIFDREKRKRQCYQGGRDWSDAVTS